MPEGHGNGLRHKDPARNALLEAIHLVSGECFEQPEFSLRRDNRNRFSQRLRTIAEARNPREYRIADRVRDLFAARCENFSDEEWVSPSLVMKLICINAIWLSELSHRSGR